MYPAIPAVFSDTGLEYSAIREFVKTWDNVDIIRPDMNFGQVITTYGYPIIGKEVAEAIYYARRIRPSGEREREREVWRKRRELLGQRQRESKARCWATERLEETGTGGGGQNRRRAEISGALTTDENLNRSRRAGVVKPSGNVQKSQEDTETAEKPG
jgi:hypothetical protein